MSKKSKKERKAEREAARAAARKAERQRNIATMVILWIVVALGGVLVWLSLDGDADLADELAELDDLDELDDLGDPDDLDDPEALEDEPAMPEAMPDPAADERPIACDGELPERAAETRPVFSEPEQATEPGVAYEAVIETSCGTITIDLDEERAPEGVNAFVFLATSGFYDGLEIFRHAEGIDVFQTGSGTNDAAFQIGYQLPDELDAAEEDGYPAGTVAYANAGPGTSGSQFFLVYGDAFDAGVEAGSLQPIYTRFGMITEGLDALERMAEVPVDNEVPQERIYIESVTILADGEALPTTVAPAPDAEEPAAPEEDAADPDDDATDDSEE